LAKYPHLLVTYEDSINIAVLEKMTVFESTRLAILTVVATATTVIVTVVVFFFIIPAIALIDVTSILPKLFLPQIFVSYLKPSFRGIDDIYLH